MGLLFTEDPKAESHSLFVVQGIKQGIRQGGRTIKENTQPISSHMSRLSVTDEHIQAPLQMAYSATCAFPATSVSDKLPCQP